MTQRRHTERVATWLRQGQPWLSLLLAAAVVALLGPTAAQWLRYDRQAVMAGQGWRLLSAHLVHLGWVHLAMNAAAIVLIALALGPLHSPRRWAWLGLASALGVSLGLLLASPQVTWYVGLSGLTHGLVAAGAMGLLRQRRSLGWAWLLALAAKLAWEQTHGPMPGSQALIGGATIVDAHLYGALAGWAASLAPRRRPPPAGR